MIKSIACITLVSAILLAYGVRCSLRNRDWESEEALFTQAGTVCWRSAKVQLNLGILARRKFQWTRALEHFHRARLIEPTYCEPNYWYGLTLINQGQHMDAGIKELENSISCKYVTSDAVQALNTIYKVKSLPDENSAICFVCPYPRFLPIPPPPPPPGPGYHSPFRASAFLWPLGWPSLCPLNGQRAHEGARPRGSECLPFTSAPQPPVPYFSSHFSSSFRRCLTTFEAPTPVSLLLSCLDPSPSFRHTCLYPWHCLFLSSQVMHESNPMDGRHLMSWARVLLRPEVGRPFDACGILEQAALLSSSGPLANASNIKAAMNTCIRASLPPKEKRHLIVPPDVPDADVDTAYRTAVANFALLKECLRARYKVLVKPLKVACSTPPPPPPRVLLCVSLAPLLASLHLWDLSRSPLQPRCLPFFLDICNRHT